MGSSKKQTVGYHYRPLMHFGLCQGPIDAYLEFVAGERTAWYGEITENSVIDVNAPMLWGGEDTEGGVQGPLAIRFGGDYQAKDDWLIANLGPDQSAERGRVTATWRGGRYGAMNPYPKPCLHKVRRIYEGWDGECWYPEKAPIGLSIGSNLALYFALDLSGSMNESTPNGRSRMANMRTAIVAVLDVIGEGIAGGVVVDIMLVGFGSEPDLRTSIMRRNATSADIAALKDWVRSLTSQYWTYFTAGVVDMPPFFSASAEGATRLGFLITDGEPTAASGTSAASIAAEAAAIVATAAGSRVHGINIDLADTTYTAIVDNTGEPVPVVAGGNPDALTGVIRAAMFKGMIGINPAHIIYDTLTSVMMQGLPADEIDESSFIASADRLYAEGFGLCATYAPEKQTIDDFRSRICAIIGATCARSRIDGRWRLDLLRDDYDISTLPTITDDDILDFSFEPAILDEAVNHVVVEWKDRDTREVRTTPAVYSPAAIRIAGQVNSQKLGYQEIPSESLAIRVAQREMLDRTTPLTRITIVTTRAAYRLRKGMRFRLLAPKHGIVDMVVVVGDIDTGTLKSGAIRMKAVQDRFGMPATSYVTGEPPRGEDANDADEGDLDAILMMEAPYAVVAGALPNSTVSALDPDAAFVGVVATGTAENYRLSTGVDADALIERGRQDACPTAVITEAARGTWRDYESVAFTDGVLLDRVEHGSVALWGNEIVRVQYIDHAGGRVQVWRGCYDTVPQAHAAGERIWFFGEWLASDDIEYATGEQIHARVTAIRHSQSAAALAADVTLDQRFYRPYPPGCVQFVGQATPEYPSGLTPRPPLVEGLLGIHWEHRNRVAQADMAVASHEAGVSAEAGVTYRVQVRDAVTGVILKDVAGINGPQVYIDRADIADHNIIELWSERDGLESWQRHEFEVFAVPIGGTARLFEDGTRRAYESGHARILED